MSARHKTQYPGVFFRESDRIGGPGKERIYYIVFKKDGKLIEEKAGRQYADDMTPSRAARIRAERIEGKRMSRKELREQEAAIRQAEENRWTIERLWKAYKESRKIKGIASDENRFKLYVAPAFGQKEPREVVPLDIDRLRVNLAKQKSQNTVRHVLELLRRICNFAQQAKLAPGLSFTIHLPRAVFKTEDLTTDQLASLLQRLDAEEDLLIANLMRLAMLTGMRRGELLKLQWSDINFQRGSITIRDPKGGKDQTIPLSHEAATLLQHHPCTESIFVFPGKNGQPRKCVAKKVRGIVTDAGIDKNFRPLHGLRHTYASMLASSGQVDLYTLQKLLTHKSPDMTQRYAHLRDEALKKAAGVAGQLINESLMQTKRIGQQKP